LRNPYGLSFDGSDFYVADVGQNEYEEVNLVERGGNYGWNVREATHCFSASDCPSSTPANVRGGETLVSPIIEYPHPDSGKGISGRSVIGGHVYRGSTLSTLDGVYLFGDLQAQDRLFVASSPDSGDGLWPIDTIDVAGGLRTILSFGQDRDGEVYVLGVGSEGSGVYQLASTSST
jgi:hypothetical protein